MRDDARSGRGRARATASCTARIAANVRPVLAVAGAISFLILGGLAGCGEDPVVQLQREAEQQRETVQREDPGIFITVGQRTLSADTAVSPAATAWHPEQGAFNTQIIAAWTYGEEDEMEYGVIRAALVLVGSEGAGVALGRYAIDPETTVEAGPPQTGSLVLSDLGLGLPETLTGRSGTIELETLERGEEPHLGRLLVRFEGTFTDDSDGEHEVSGTIRFHPREGG